MADELEDLKAVLPPLLQSLEALNFIARYLYPPELEQVVQAAGAPDEALREALPRLAGWPESLAGMRSRLEAAAEQVITAFAELRTAAGQDQPAFAAYRALRAAPRAQEALYPLAPGLPPLNRFFHDPAAGDEVHALTLGVEAGEMTGISHINSEPGQRGGLSVYVPEYYTPDRAWPLVMALHGGSGNGRGFLWSWLRTARSHGAILIAPTAVGETWALQTQDVDTPNFERILAGVRRNWNVDPTRLLLTGMSDGGTFSYLTGLQHGTFTHLAPVAASFHPMMAQLADEERVRDLPIYITHGALDWMFPVAMAQDAAWSLKAVGADVTYREISDLSHTYPREVNWPILEWLAGR